MPRRHRTKADRGIKRPEPLAGRVLARIRPTRRIVVLCGILGALAVLGAVLFGIFGPSGSSPKRAAIIDQLVLTQPNPDFVDSATGILTGAGYKVDYFSGQDVTVDLFRDLPAHHYDLIVFRVHAGLVQEIAPGTGARTPEEYVALFTGEPYSATKYPAEPAGRLAKARYSEGNGELPPLFGIAPNFISRSMRGNFDHTLIVMMGCDGLRSQTTADAFLQKGASSFVSWSQQVSAAHTDAATTVLLSHLVRDGQSTSDAVNNTASEVGPDPAYGAQLRFVSRQG